MLICHFDYPSPAAAVAVLRVQREADAGGAVAFSGFDVLGLDTALPVTLDQLSSLEAHQPRAAALGLQLRRPRRRPATIGAHLVGQLAEEADLGAAWRWAALRAYWEDGVDLGSPQVLTDLAAEVGLDPQRAAAAVADRPARARLRQRAIQLRSRGIGDVPVLEVDGTLLSADIGDDDLRQLAGR